MPVLSSDLARSPKLRLYLEEIARVLDEEQSRREAFYASVTEQQKAEFINGETIIHSPVRFAHDQVSGRLYTLLRAFVLRHGLGHVGHEKLLVSLTRNDYEPDVCFFGRGKADSFRPGQMRFPAPDFVAEVLSETTEAIDRGVKLEDYAAHGVEEYWILDPDAGIVEQYVLSGEVYELRLKSDSGVVKSTAVAGLVLPIAALFDDQENLTALQQILS